MNLSAPQIRLLSERQPSPWITLVSAALEQSRTERCPEQPDASPGGVASDGDFAKIRAPA
jgi:hypothetical protein